MIAPFAKKPLHLTLQGITTDDNDLSVSYLCNPLAGYLIFILQGGYNTNCDPTSLAIVWRFGWS